MTMNWEEKYADRVMSPEAACALIRSGDTLASNFGGSIPYAFLDTLADYSLGRLENVTLYLAGFYKQTKIADRVYNSHIAVKSCFLGPWERKVIAEGSNLSYQAMHLANINHDRMGKHRARVLLAAGSVPDENGMISLGVAPFDPKLLDICETVIVQVNRNMPFVYGENCRIPAERVTALVPMDEELPEMVMAAPNDIQRRIAGHIVERVVDGACVQFGIGGISAAIGEALMERHDLGCHSEMLTEPIMALMKAGVINNSRKSFCPGKTAFTNALGTAELYRFMDRNPALEAHPTAWLNDPRNIAKNDNMISVNGALCVDLTGQVCAESIGFRQFSGTGGQLDYVRGARWSRGGKSFLTIPSVHVDKAGVQRSNISLTLPAGSIITTPRADVHFVVTEYGAADLQDEPVDVRAKRLIAVAHPDFRDELLFQAKKAGYIV